MYLGISQDTEDWSHLFWKRMRGIMQIYQQQEKRNV